MLPIVRHNKLDLFRMTDSLLPAVIFCQLSEHGVIPEKSHQFMVITLHVTPLTVYVARQHSTAHFYTTL